MREIEFYGGPFDGKRQQVPGLEGMDWPPFMCSRQEKTDRWQHYMRSHSVEGRYVYGGDCTDLRTSGRHPDPFPHDH